MESGITSAQHGRIPLDHGNCSKMAGMWLLVQALQKVGCTKRIFYIRLKTNIMPKTESIMLFYREAFPMSYLATMEVS